jgi:transposase
MEVPACPGCRERDARIDTLQRRVDELEKTVRDLQTRLGTNASNSSLPPSANPLGAAKPVVKKKSRRRRGGQPGHPPHLKQLLPAERVNAVVPYIPERCSCCDAPLSAEPEPSDPEPHRFQVIELPPLVATVTEHQGHARTCSTCGTVTKASIPHDVLAHSVGPRLTGTLSYFSGCHGVSKRGVEEIAEAVFQAPVSLGTVSNLEQEVSEALAEAHTEALTAVREAKVKGADETSWKEAGKLRWLWAAATTTVAVFLIHARRSAAGLTALLGAEIQGILCSDRWGVYNRVPAERRQICWAHLKRDFQKIVDREGPDASLGRRGLRLVTKVFAAWHAFREKRSTREEMRAAMERHSNRMNHLLLEGAINGHEKSVIAFCENLLALEASMWTFTDQEGVEPTNNGMERLLRRAVLWRRRSFGCVSDRGCRFVERILTVVQTRRLQGRSVLDYLQAAVEAARSGRACPQLLAAR